MNASLLLKQTRLVSVDVTQMDPAFGATIFGDKLLFGYFDDFKRLKNARISGVLYGKTRHSCERGQNLFDNVALTELKRSQKEMKLKGLQEKSVETQDRI